MRIIEATERSSIDIPITELLREGGVLKIRPDLIGKGLVELRQSRQTLQLRVNGLVGRLPITDELALDIRPKFSISNLNTLVYRSRVELDNPFYINRPYRQIETREYLPVPLVRSFADSIERVIAQGLHREYIRELVTSSPRPKIDFIKSHQRHWSKLDLSRAVVERYDHSLDNLPNQCIKLASTKAMSLAKTTEQLLKCVPSLAASLRQLERVKLRTAYAVLKDLPTARARLPSFRSDYQQAISQALEILRHIDVALDVAGKGIALESYIISLDDVFERYLRNVLASISHPIDGVVSAVDGNQHKHQRPLFSDNKIYRVKPDFVFRSKSGTLLIGDAKYKTKAVEEDRYQVITHALSYGVDKAILIYPRRNNESQNGLVRLGRIGSGMTSIVVYEYYFDLAADLEEEEKALRTSVQHVLA